MSDNVRLERLKKQEKSGKMGRCEEYDFAKITKIAYFN
jgi:hypothetical protein